MTPAHCQECSLCSLRVSQRAGSAGGEEAGAPGREPAPLVLGVCRGGASVSCPWQQQPNPARDGHWDGHGSRAARGSAPRGCSEQAPGGAAAWTEPTDIPKIPQGPAGLAWECGHVGFAEELRQQFPVPTSWSSHTSSRCVPASPNPFPPSPGTSSSSSVTAKGISLTEMESQAMPSEMP